MAWRELTVGDLFLNGPVHVATVSGKAIAEFNPVLTRKGYGVVVIPRTRSVFKSIGQVVAEKKKEK